MRNNHALVLVIRVQSELALDAEFCIFLLLQNAFIVELLLGANARRRSHFVQFKCFAHAIDDFSHRAAVVFVQIENGHNDLVDTLQCCWRPFVEIELSAPIPFLLELA